MVTLRQTLQPWFTALLSLFFPGLGHIYCGYRIRGILWLACLYFVLWLFASFTNISDLPVFYSVFLLQALFYLVIVIDSFRLAAKRRNGPYDARISLPVFILFAVAIGLIESTYSYYRSELLGVDHYRLASGSMTPRLQKGDYVIVDTRVQSRDNVSIGDVVVFNLLGEKHTFVKRISGIAGDEVTIRSGKVYRNGVLEPRLEVLDQRRRRQSSQTMRASVVQEGEVFVLGDWRDNSKDSRVRGSIPVDNILGIVTAVWFSPDFYRIGRLNNQLIIQQ